ncbi:MAG TPA: hypothetical protein VGC56_13285 [Allosphingosinicella sp.]
MRATRGIGPAAPAAAARSVARRNEGAKAMDGTGQYRCRGADPSGHTAFVNDRSIAFDIAERLYRLRGYLPPFDDLPWVEIGEARPSRMPTGLVKRR